jgi:hypothetical protein
VRVGVSNDQVEDRRVQELQHFDSRTRRNTAEELETRFERWPALGGILVLWRDSERLAEIFLVQTNHATGGVKHAVIAGDEQKAAIRHHARFGGRCTEPHLSCKRHRECLIFCRGRKAFDGRFQNVCGWLPWRGQSDGA